MFYFSKIQLIFAMEVYINLIFEKCINYHFNFSHLHSKTIYLHSIFSFFIVADIKTCLTKTKSKFGYIEIVANILNI